MSNENLKMKEKLRHIDEVLKQVPGVHLQDIRSFINGTISVNRKGELKIPLTLPAEELLPIPDDVGQVARGEWKIVPLLMFVEPDK